MLLVWFGTRLEEELALTYLSEICFSHFRIVKFYITRKLLV